MGAIEEGFLVTIFCLSCRILAGKHEIVKTTAIEKSREAHMYNLNLMYAPSSFCPFSVLYLLLWYRYFEPKQLYCKQSVFSLNSSTM